MKVRVIMFTPERATRVVEGRQNLKERVRRFITWLFTPTLDGP